MKMFVNYLVKIMLKLLECNIACKLILGECTRCVDIGCHGFEFFEVYRAYWPCRGSEPSP